MAGKSTKKNSHQANDQLHHPQCGFVALPRAGCESCELLYAVEDGHAIIQANEAMEMAILHFRERIVEREISIREESSRFRASDTERMKTIRARKADETERVEEARTACITATRRRTRIVVLETDGHKRLARKVKTTANKLEKDGRLPRDLAQHLYAFAKRVADGMGAATEDGHDSSNRTTAGYQPVATLSGYGSRTMADRHLTGMAAHQEMRHRIPSELMPIYDQIVDEEVTGRHPLGRTLHELGEALGYKHKQTTAAGGALVYAVVCLIAHYMRGRGIPRGELRQTVTSPRLLQESA